MVITPLGFFCWFMVITLALLVAMVLIDKSTNL